MDLKAKAARKAAWRTFTPTFKKKASNYSGDTTRC